MYFSDKSKPPLDYQYERKAAAMVDNVISKIATKVKLIDSATSLDKLIESAVSFF